MSSDNDQYPPTGRPSQPPPPSSSAPTPPYPTAYPASQYPSPVSDHADTSRQRPRGAFDAGRLWSGAAAASVVVALVGVVGVLITRGIFDLELITPLGEPMELGWLIAVSVLGTLAATGLMHLFLSYSPQPLTFFSWIAALVALIVILLPYVHDTTLSTQVASSLVYLFIALAIGSLVSGIADSAIHARRARR